MWPAAWVERRTGLDGGAEWRGSYDDEAGALAILERDGGLVGVMRRGAAVCGLSPIPEMFARRGDIGVIEANTSAGPPQIGAIYLGDGRWSAMSADGVRVISARPPRRLVVACWRVP